MKAKTGLKPAPLFHRKAWQWSKCNITKLGGLEGRRSFFASPETILEASPYLAWEPSMELKIQGLSKTYPNGVKALDNVSLTIPHGMYGLLGPNGAGKSTLMRTLATLQEPDTGTAFLGEIDVLKRKEDVRRKLGYLPQDFGVYPRISAQDMLDHIALLKGIVNRKERKEIVMAMLQRCNLYDSRKKPLTSFSGAANRGGATGLRALPEGKPRNLLPQGDDWRRSGQPCLAQDCSTIRVHTGSLSDILRFGGCTSRTNTT